jgi:hypothetical protein
MNSVKALHLHAMVRFDQKKGAEFPFTFLFTQSKKGVLLHGLEQYSRVFFCRPKKTRNTKIAFLGLGRFFLLPVQIFGLFELPHTARPK